MDAYADRMTDNSLKHLNKLTILKKLYMFNCMRMYSEGMKAISELQMLEALHVIHAVHLSAETIINTFSKGNLKNLKELKLYSGGISSEALKVIASNCPKLTFLETREQIVNWDVDTDEESDEVFELYNFCEKGEEYPENVMAFVRQKCPHLKHLSCWKSMSATWN